MAHIRLHHLHNANLAHGAQANFEVKQSINQQNGHLLFSLNITYEPKCQQFPFVVPVAMSTQCHVIHELYMSVLGKINK